MPLGATRGFLLKWRLGWEHVAEYFGKEFHLDLYDSSFQFINVVHAPPGVRLCHPISVIDSRDGLLQSSYHGPDVIKGVVGFCNNPPPILQPGSSIQRLNKRRARKMAYDASIQWQTYTVNTSYSRMLQVSNDFMEELRELVAVPFVDDGTAGENSVSFGYVSIANYNIIASRPRPVSEHNHLLSHCCQKRVDFRVVARESGCTNVMIGIPSNGIEVSLPLGTISKRELVQPLINSLFPDSVLRLIKIATLPLVSSTLLLVTWLWLTLL